VGECPISFVTVFNDRAEIIRDVLVKLESGKTEITISGVSKFIDTNSIRVVGAQGEATILEVSGNTSYLKTQSVREKHTQEIQQLEKELNRLKKEIDRIKKENEWVEGWARNLMKPVTNIKGDKNDREDPYQIDPYTSVRFEKTDQFLEFYQKRLEDIDSRLEENNEKYENYKNL